MEKHILSFKTFLKMLARYGKENGITYKKFNKVFTSEFIEKIRKSANHTFLFSLLSAINRNSMIEPIHYMSLSRILRRLAFREFKMNVFTNEDYRKILSSIIVRHDIKDIEASYVYDANGIVVSFYFTHIDYKPNIHSPLGYDWFFKKYTALREIELDNLKKCI